MAGDTCAEIRVLIRHSLVEHIESLRVSVDQMPEPQSSTSLMRPSKRPMHRGSRAGSCAIQNSHLACQWQLSGCARSRDAEQPFAFKYHPDFLERGRDVAYGKANVSKTDNVSELLAAVLQEDNCALESEPTLK